MQLLQTTARLPLPEAVRHPAQLSIMVQRQQFLIRLPMPQVIRQCTKLAQASSEGRPIFLADRDSKGAQDINVLIAEVLKRLQAKPEAATTTDAAVPAVAIAQSA